MNPSSSVRKDSDTMHVKCSPARTTPEKTRLFASLVVFKHFCLVKEPTGQLQPSTTGSFFPCFVLFFVVESNKPVWDLSFEQNFRDDSLEVNICG